MCDLNALRFLSILKNFPCEFADKLWRSDQELLPWRSAASVARGAGTKGKFVGHTEQFSQSIPHEHVKKKKVFHIVLLIWCLTTTFVLDAIRIYQVIYYVLYCPILLDEGFKLKWGQKKKKTSDKDKAFCPTWDKKIRADTLTYTSLKLDWSMKVLGYSNSHEYNLPIIGWLWGDVILILIIFVKKLLYHVQNYAFIRVLMTETYICNQTNSCMPCEYYLTKVKS